MDSRFLFFFSSLLAKEHYRNNKNMATTAPQRIFPPASTTAPHFHERIYSYVHAIIRVFERAKMGWLWP